MLRLLDPPSLGDGENDLGYKGPSFDDNTVLYYGRRRQPCLKLSPPTVISREAGFQGLAVSLFDLEDRKRELD